jgi:hypothetical protein
LRRTALVVWGLLGPGSPHQARGLGVGQPQEIRQDSEETVDIIKVNEMDCEMPDFILMLLHFEFVALNQRHIFYYIRNSSCSLADFSIKKFKF